MGSHPNRGRAASPFGQGLGRPGRVEGTRELVVPRTPYIIPYTVIGDRVMILSIIHSARQWPDRF
jgi:plasmid stabilization system protein ParE